MHRKGLVIGILILMLGVNIGSAFAVDVDVKTMSSVGFDRNTLYVGGSGPNNYTTIQSAIDDAVDGDTVFVYDDSSPYYENLVINSSINLIGEDKNTTVIDGKYIDNVIKINVNNTRIDCFSIRCSGDDSYLTDAGIYLFSSKNHILNCVFYDNHWAFKNNIVISNFNFLSNNYFHDNNFTLWVEGTGNEIINNIITKTIIGSGIALRGNNNLVIDNIISDNNQNDGIYLGGSDNIVMRNHIANNLVGIECDTAYRNKIERNNLVDNDFQAGVAVTAIHGQEYRNKWDNNYWSDYLLSGVFPKVIFSFNLIAYRFGPFVLYFPYCFIEVDWHPAQEPYDIGV